MLQKSRKSILSFSNAQVLAIVLASIAVMALFSVELDLLIKIIVLTAYTIFCSWTASISIKDYLTSQHFKKRQHFKIYDRIETNAISVLVMIIISFGLILMLNRSILILTVVISVSLISIYFGRQFAAKEIDSKPTLSEMSEDQYSRRIDIVRSAIEDLQEIQSTSFLTRDMSDLIGSIDYCVNYLPIEYFFQQLDFFEIPNFRTINKLVKIANDSAADRTEDEVLEMLIADAKSVNLSIDDLLYYLNDIERTQLL